MNLGMLGTENKAKLVEKIRDELVLVISFTFKQTTGFVIKQLKQISDFSSTL